MKRRRIKPIRVIILVLLVSGYIYGLCKLFSKVDAPVLSVPFELPEVENKAISGIPVVENNYKSLGIFKITYYCPGSCCNGSNAGVDCKGNPLIEGTIATNDLPYGTEVYININGELKKFTVRDRMAKKYRKTPHIDIFVNRPHDEVQNMGVDYFEVFIKE